MINSADLTATLARQVTVLVDDLRERADEVPEIGDRITQQWKTATDSGRTDREKAVWREDLFAQVAASWVLGCVFVRFSEDNELIPEPTLSGPGDRRRWAREAQLAFFRRIPAAGERRYLEHVFNCAASSNGLGDIFGKHNPVRQFGPSDDACRALIDLWRETRPEAGELVWDFTDRDLDTRFLGDLYQDLSAHARKTYALLQTPEFIESFILDRTLDPAIEEFGLSGHDGTGFRMIDPACGSGHFLLGAFKRLAERHLKRDSAAGRRSAAARALEGVYGVDINPYAAAIARFRLLVAALRFAGIRTLAEAPAFTINVAVGDSLLHSLPPGQLRGVRQAVERQSDEARHLYETEDAETVLQVLAQEYHAVVANPPYITPKDPAANRSYRERYKTCHRKYSLAVPFMELLFGLAHRGSNDPAGYVGQITANSFMKREFGKRVITNFLGTRIDLTHLIDTGAVYVPGHGTPTVILIGRNRSPVSDYVRAVLGIRGETSSTIDPGGGKVWSSILEVIDLPEAENHYVSSTDMPRTRLRIHPWSLQGGSASPLMKRIEAGRTRLVKATVSIGFHAISGEDAVFFGWPSGALSRKRIPSTSQRAFVPGEVVRNWSIAVAEKAIFPYDSNLSPYLCSQSERLLWPCRSSLSAGLMFGKTREMRRMKWFEYTNFSPNRDRTPLSIAFAFVESHNHFVLDRGGKVFKQSAPVIKLRYNASEDDHLELLGLLNSSLACFWMKQVFHNKGAGGGLSRAEKWHDFYEFEGTKLKQFPLATDSAVDWSRSLDRLASKLEQWLPAVVAERETPTEGRLHESEARVTAVRARMVWLQEELDWRCMFLYGITEEDLSFSPEDVFELDKGQRAFEIALARQMAKGEVETSWFERHGSVPITALPESWPESYRLRVEQRLELIESDRFVGLLERPEYKRRWAWERWDKLAQTALRSWLLTRLEDSTFWPRPEPRSVAQLADAARADDEFVSVARLYTHNPEVDFVTLVAELTGSDAVPYLASLRYKEPGIRKHRDWERTWNIQRREDAGVEVGRMPVPPRYTSADYRSPIYWRLRGKLDVAKERFISYPGLERSTDPTPVLGWADWDHLERAQALTALKHQREQTEGWGADNLRPLLAGLDELVPWLRQWHNDYDSAGGHRLGDYFADYLVSECNRLGLSAEDLQGWRPHEKRRGRRKKAGT